MDSLVLNCWVRSEDVKIFHIKMSKTDSVCDLQDAIKSKKSALFHNVDADTLNLYKPKDRISQPYKDNLSSFTLLAHGELLEGADELSEVFPELLARRDIHVIVDAPSTITCWMRGVNLDQCFEIPIQPGGSVHGLIPSIRNAQLGLADATDHQIRFYKISGDDNDLREVLNRTGDGEHLQRGPLVPNFLDIPVLNPLRIIVEKMPRPTRTNPSVLCHSVLAGQDPVAAARKAFVIDRPQGTSPSDAAKPSAFHQTQGTPHTRIPCGRPRDPEVLIPVTLLHPIFAQFAEDCRTGAMKELDNNLVGQLANSMSALHDNEDARVKSVSQVLEMVHLTLDLNKKVNDTNYMMDASLSFKHRDVELPYFIGEFKNEIGSTSSEPYIQAITYYLEATKKLAQIQSKSTLPCLLIVIFGPFMFFAAAVWNLRPVVQTLSHPLSFDYHSTDTEVQLIVARHMAAFRKALRSLKTHYEDKSNGLVPDHPAGEALFPYYTKFTSLDDGSEQTFTYTNQFIDNNQARTKTKLVFFGALKDDPAVKVCIKFTRRYSKDVHLHFSEPGFAPRLRGFENLPGGWKMIVMDDLRGYDVLADFGDERLPRTVFEAIGTQLETLHARNLVHGDVRDANVMISRDRKRFAFVDFDWSGEVGSVVYPPYVNRVTVSRPKSVRDGELVTAEHDLDMLRRMTEAWVAGN